MKQTKTDNETASGTPEVPTPEAIAADKAAQAHYRATYAAALPPEPEAPTQVSGYDHSPLPWYVIKNGKQIDIHSKDSLANREWTVAQNLREHDAQFIVEMINSRTPEWYLRNQAVNHAAKLAEALRGAIVIIQSYDHISGVSEMKAALAAYATGGLNAQNDPEFEAVSKYVNSVAEEGK